MRGQVIALPECVDLVAAEILRHTPADAEAMSDSTRPGLRYALPRRSTFPGSGSLRRRTFLFCLRTPSVPGRIRTAKVTS